MKHLLAFCLLLASVSLVAQNRAVSGRVTDPDDMPLAGASVSLSGNRSVHTQTDTTGRFSLQAPAGVKSIVVTRTGYLEMEIRLKSNQKEIRVRLSPDEQHLGEVVVVGFGTQSKHRVTGAIASAGEEAFKNVSVPVFQRALQGQLPGVVITNASGGLNAESIIRVRGIGSISAGNQPLVVVDGLILPGLGGVESLGFFTNPFLAINPGDIASVEVLKDAAAASIYGARGANGVILITTRIGRFDQKPRVHLGYYAGFSEISKRRELLDGREYATLWNQAAVNAGLDTVPDLLYDVAAQPSTDWQDMILRRGFVQEIQAGVSGGSAQSRYAFGAAFRDEDAYLITLGLKRYSMRLNVEQKINDRISAGISLSPTRVVDRRAGNQWAGSPFGWAAWYFPNVAAFDENGKFRRDVVSTPNGFGGFAGNPGTTLKNNSVQTTTTQLLTRTFLSWRVSPNLEFKTDLGAAFNQIQELARQRALEGFSGSGWQLNQQLFNYNWTNLLVWHQNWQSRHALDVTSGVQLTRETLEGSYLSFSGFADDALPFLGAAAQVDYKESWANDAAFAGFLARANYALQGKYLVTLSTRYDGSSRFGADKRYGFFPALSAGWILSDESFFHFKIIDFLKIRSSIGLSGNAAIGDFTARSRVSFEPEYGGQPGYIIRSVENNRLGWEKNRQWDAGLEFSLWKDRLSGALEYYIRDTRDLLLETPVPATNGVATLIRNVGAVRNQGFEFELVWQILRRSAFQWELRLNGATLKNKILRLVDNNDDGRDDDFVLNNRILYRTGESIGTFFLVEYAGVDPANGDALFYNLAGNTVANSAPAVNRQIVGKSLPGFTGGFTQVFRYRNFDLSAFFHFKTGHKIYLEENALYSETNMSGTLNQLKTQLNAWTLENPNTDVPQARLFRINGSQPSTRYLKKADFLRLNHLELGYTFQPGDSGRVSLRVFAAAQNLLTVTPFTGLDPDAEFYPANSSALGAVRYNLPAARTYTFGLSADF